MYKQIRHDKACMLDIYIYMCSVGFVNMCEIYINKIHALKLSKHICSKKRHHQKRCRF